MTSESIWRFRRANEVAPEGSMLTNMGWLVPVEPCIHGNIEGHYWQGKDLLEWCPGAGIGDGG